MRQILNELNAETGITGIMVITKDGIMVAASLGQDLEEDAVAAFASSLLVSMKRGLTDLQAPGEQAVHRPVLIPPVDQVLPAAHMQGLGYPVEALAAHGLQLIKQLHAQALRRGVASYQARGTRVIDRAPRRTPDAGN